MASRPLRAAGFEGEALATMLGIEWVECLDPQTGLHYSDAVGDLALVSAVWGPSIGSAQVRSLRDPTSGNAADRWRIAGSLRDPFYNAAAAWQISVHGTVFTPWSAFKSGAFVDHVGEDFELHTGHKNADRWNA